MRWPAAISLSLAAVVFQILAGHLYRFGGAAPSFVAIVVVHVALVASPRAALVAAAVGGALTDSLSLDPWGCHLLGSLLAAHSVRRGRETGWADSLPTRALLGALAFALALAIPDGVAWLLESRRPVPELLVAGWLLTLVFAVPVRVVLSTFVAAEPRGGR